MLEQSLKSGSGDALYLIENPYLSILCWLGHTMAIVVEENSLTLGVRKGGREGGREGEKEKERGRERHIDRDRQVKRKRRKNGQTSILKLAFRAHSSTHTHTFAFLLRVWQSLRTSSVVGSSSCL